MRVALIARSTLFKTPGGDTVQVRETAKHLQQLGVHATVHLSTDHFNYNDYGLLHFFNIIRPADILRHLHAGKPYVVSTIFVDYSAYDKLRRGPIFKILSPGFTGYAKTLGRWLRGNDSIASREYLWLGHTRSIRKILDRAACLLPNSENEYRRLQAAFNIDKKYFVAPNGIDEGIFKEGPREKDANMVVCAARIEGIKNQLNLIKALNNTRFKLYLVGNPAPNHRHYYQECKKLAAPNIIFLNHLSQPELLEYYTRAKVHVLPSWFETTGLSSLEAAAMGCNIVITNRGDAPEYFGEKAFYCDPASPESIYQSVESAAASPVDPGLEKEIRTKFTWHEAALSTVRAYRAII